MEEANRETISPGRGLYATGERWKDDEAGKTLTLGILSRALPALYLDVLHVSWLAA